MPRRTNYRGRTVAYPLGALLLVAALAALVAGPSRWLVFLAGVGCLGLIDDLTGGEPRGLRGHGRALARGEPSTGALKAAGTVVLALYAADGLADAALLTVAAHAGNLLDTRPGRIEKAFALTALAVCAGTWSPAPLDPIAALLAPVALGAWLTLRERAMLGDSGASLIGGMAGVCLVLALSAPGTYAALAGLIAISLYGEFRSLSAALERLPLLHRLDSLGRAN
jgi:UDP-GlcNAc:undecaprenyl-phosphate GlcNAc-1-phosphate transferase